MFAMSTFHVAVSTVNRLKWSKENDWLCNTNTHPGWVHCASIQMVCETLVFSSHKSSWYWLTPFSVHAMCPTQSVFAERERNLCECNVVEIIHNPLCCQNTLRFYWAGVKRCGVQTQSHILLFKTWNKMKDGIGNNILQDSFFLFFIFAFLTNILFYEQKRWE